ncbi:glycosyl hydrolase [Leptolyngbya sp. FACHB-36]|uniref:glycosyl hydrolase family 8 n=1 Tax=Leptolyngbya sp. FACHB-36 TaxID=2692808 RepID=UPI0016816341|nr:glycosyl hydrolase family 8 [Leptolyngbya sp. FACHB-36]MBD2019116.1 glycosyl hydrolase [Leptolyngbya sp. FACHB-36]
MSYPPAPFVIVALMLLLGLAGCQEGRPTPSGSAVLPASPIARSSERTELLKQSWDAYRQRFIQTDGRVIDWEAEGRSTSEGQGYAMLRAVLMDDADTFARTLEWAERNLRRQTAGKPSDSLWAWKWGQTPRKTWDVLDRNFASDGDIDAITALILASRRWNRPEYLQLAQTKLRDLWTLSTVAVGDRRYLLPGPREAFQQGVTLTLNPSYQAPYAFRMFAQVDSRDWLSLVSSSYEVLERSSVLSTVKLPSDWIALDLLTKRYSVLPESSSLRSQYSFDAYRVWWRVALDAAWFDAPEAKTYLQRHLGYLRELWRSQQRIPARLTLQGKPTVPYEALSQYGVLYTAFQTIDPVVAEQIYQQKLAPAYREGIWENPSAYYTQNLVWFGLVPPTALSPRLLHPNTATQRPGHDSSITQLYRSLITATP